MCTREILNHIGLTNKSTNFKRHIEPIVEQNWIGMTIPEKPQSSKQQYMLTEKEKKLIELINVWIYQLWNPISWKIEPVRLTGCWAWTGNTIESRDQSAYWFPGEYLMLVPVIVSSTFTITRWCKPICIINPLQGINETENHYATIINASDESEQALRAI